MICELFPYSISWLPAFKMFADHRYANIKRNVSYAEFAPGVFRCSFFYEIFTNFRNFRSKFESFQRKISFSLFLLSVSQTAHDYVQQEQQHGASTIKISRWHVYVAALLWTLIQNQTFGHWRC